MTALLEVVTGSRTGLRIPIPAQGLVIGRESEVDGPLLDDASLSRRHARVINIASGEALLEDLGSTNGTYLNDVRVTQPVLLHDGALIQVGDTCLKFVAEPQAEGYGSSDTAITARSGGVAVGGSISAQDGAIGAIGQVGGNVDLSRHRHDYDASGLGLITRSRGAARLLLVLGTLMGFVGFGLFAYPIVTGIVNAASNFSASDTASRRCDERFPERGPAWFDCQQEASRSAGGDFPSLTPWIPMGGALLFGGMVLSVIGLFMIKHHD